MNRTDRFAPGVVGLAALLIATRFRSLWNSLRRGPRPGPARALVLLALLVPATYVGLFAAAFSTIGDEGGRVAQATVLALVAGVITLGSLASKLASPGAVAGGGDLEFLLVRPVPLETIVLARSLAGVATDIFDALFLFPILLSASLTWGLGPVAIVTCVVSSMAAQVTVSALAQGIQVVAARVVPARWHGAIRTAASLFSALSLAFMWMAGTAVLRDPRAFANHLKAWSSLLSFSPVWVLVAPIIKLGQGASALAALLALFGMTLATLLLVRGLAMRARRHGWEPVVSPFGSSSRFAPSHTADRPLSLFRKDFRLLLRDRSRLVTLIALPMIFVGLQIFGSAGLDWVIRTPTRIALLAYSLAAYAATFGPLGHLESERRAFWILRSVPVPISRLMFEKSLFWAVFLLGLVAATYGGLLAVAPAVRTMAMLGPAVLVAFGALMASFLAVGLACGAADLSDDSRNAVGVGTAYTFMLVAGLFNIAIIERGEFQFRALALFGLATGVVWRVGILRVGDALDPDWRRRADSPATGALLAVLVFLGGRATQRVAAIGLDTGGTDGVQLGWTGLLAAIAVIACLKRNIFHRTGRMPLNWRGVAAGLACGAAGFGLMRTLPMGAPRAPWLLLVSALTHELVVRGLFQARWVAMGPRRPFHQIGAVVLSSVMAFLVSDGPDLKVAAVTAVFPAVACALCRTPLAATVSAIVARGLITAGIFFH